MSVLVGGSRLGQGTPAKVVRKHTQPDGDLALLRLDHPIQTTYVALATADSSAPAVDEIYGWGRTDQGTNPSPRLKVATVIVTREPCWDAFGGHAICSRAGDGIAFNGDSGGPQLHGGVQVGVCSTGDEQFRTQQYSSVAKGRSWIRATAGV
jgi:secreted trypsin-like serine protease